MILGYFLIIAREMQVWGLQGLHGLGFGDLLRERWLHFARSSAYLNVGSFPGVGQPHMITTEALLFVHVMLDHVA